MTKRPATRGKRPAPVLVTSTAAILGFVLQVLRKDSTYSQAHFARLLRVSTSSLGRMERGETDMSISELLLVSHVLKVDPRDILAALWAGKKAVMDKGIDVVTGTDIRHDSAIVKDDSIVVIDGRALSKLIRFPVAKSLFSSIG